MKKQLLVLGIALSMSALNAQTTTPTPKKGTDSKGTEQPGTQKGSKQNNQNSNQQNGTQKGTQNGKQSTEQKGMRQSGTGETESWNSVTPPSSVSDKFSSEYPGMDVKWSKDGENYSGEYMDNSTNMGRNVVYDKDGNIIRTDNEMSPDGLNYPSTIGDYHNKNFPNEGYKVWQTDDGKGNKWFYTKRKNGTIWFDKDGNYYPGKSGKSDEKIKNTK
ncbi:MAG: hypothetical protein K0R26_2447 [Bacteroidota bacterium]|jgi:hypothetical protein|nr:hypothetical protein [Bacteroidota bacterium]